MKIQKKTDNKTKIRTTVTTTAFESGNEVVYCGFWEARRANLKLVACVTSVTSGAHKASHYTGISLSIKVQMWHLSLRVGQPKQLSKLAKLPTPKELQNQ